MNIDQLNTISCIQHANINEANWLEEFSLRAKALFMRPQNEYLIESAEYCEKDIMPPFYKLFKGLGQ